MFQKKAPTKNHLKYYMTLCVADLTTGEVFHV